MIGYRCGCVNEIHKPTGILHSVKKCKTHRAAYRDPATIDESYYEAFGFLKDGKIIQSAHIAQLTEALGPLPETNSQRFALEIGCGVSPYCYDIMKAGWRYIGLDPSQWVSRFMSNWFPTIWMIEGSWEAQTDLEYIDFMLCAHALEHLTNASASVAKMVRSLLPHGHLWIVVPDDSDPVNPDHLWFFTEATLRNLLESSGLIVERIVTRKYIERESFIYASARKPA